MPILKEEEKEVYKNSITKFKSFFTKKKKTKNEVVKKEVLIKKKEMDLLKFRNSSEEKLSEISNKMNLADEKLFFLGTSVKELSEIYSLEKFEVMVVDINYQLLYANPFFIQNNHIKEILFADVKQYYQNISQNYESLFLYLENNNLEYYNLNIQIKIGYQVVVINNLIKSIYTNNEKKGYLWKITYLNNN
jgi:hypothetical protein